MPDFLPCRYVLSCHCWAVEGWRKKMRELWVEGERVRRGSRPKQRRRLAGGSLRPSFRDSRQRPSLSPARARLRRRFAPGSINPREGLEGAVYEIGRNPGPSSAIERSTRSSAASMSTTTEPPRGLWRKPLSIRLLRACRSRAESTFARVGVLPADLDRYGDPGLSQC